MGWQTVNVLPWLFFITSAQFSLPQGLLNSVCFVESHMDVNKVHKNDGPSDSIGVCQVKLSTSKWLGFRGNDKDLLRPSENIYYAAKYLARNVKRYGDIPRALVAYNQGSAKSLTRTRYSDKVLAIWRQNDITYRF